jgi:hypothetical protein
MEHLTKRSSRTRRTGLGSAALAVAAVAVIGLTTVTPAKADWRHDDWRYHSGVGFGFSIGGPAYGYYPYPAYPAYPAYPVYGYPYYGYSPYYYGGPSVTFSYSNR